MRVPWCRLLACLPAVVLLVGGGVPARAAGADGASSGDGVAIIGQQWQPTPRHVVVAPGAGDVLVPVDAPRAPMAVGVPFGVGVPVIVVGGGGDGGRGGVWSYRGHPGDDRWRAGTADARFARWSRVHDHHHHHGRDRDDWRDRDHDRFHDGRRDRDGGWDRGRHGGPRDPGPWPRSPRSPR